MMIMSSCEAGIVTISLFLFSSIFIFVFIFYCIYKISLQMIIIIRLC